MMTGSYRRNEEKKRIQCRLFGDIAGDMCDMPLNYWMRERYNSYAHGNKMIWQTT